MVLVELDVGNIMPYVTREAPSTTSFCHDDSTVILLLTCDNDSTLERVSRVGSPSCSTTAQGYNLWDWKLKHDVNNKFIIWLSTCLLLQRTKTWEKQLTSADLDADHPSDHGTVYCRPGDYHFTSILWSLSLEALLSFPSSAVYWRLSCAQVKIDT